MARPSVFSLEDEYRLICAVALGEMSVAEAARRAMVSEQPTPTSGRRGARRRSRC